MKNPSVAAKCSIVLAGTINGGGCVMSALLRMRNGNTVSRKERNAMTKMGNTKTMESRDGP